MAAAPDRAKRLLSVALLALGACGTDSPGSSDACGDSACPGDAELYAQPCTGKVVAAVPAQDCPAQACSGPMAYAVCNGKDWATCACVIPPGYSLVDAGFFGVEGGSEGGAEAGLENDARAPGDALAPKDAYPDRR